MTNQSLERPGTAKPLRNRQPRDPEDPCQCGRLSVGDGRNWNPDCSEHGLTSAWYTSPEQEAKRKAQNERLMGLYAQVRSARRGVNNDLGS